MERLVRLTHMRLDDSERETARDFGLAVGLTPIYVLP